jgi:polysaccharide pyruvyl transferase WcaK-like protein
MPEKSKAVVSVTTQFSNTGDALIVRELLALVRTYMPLIAVVSPKADDKFLKELNSGEEEIRKGGWLRILSALLRERLSGKHPLYFFLPPGDPGIRLVRDLWFRAALFPVLWALRIRIVRIGFSVSRMTRGRLRMEKWLSHWCYFQGLRDNHSLHTVEEVGFSKVGYFPDLSLNIGFDLYRDKQVSTTNPVVIISFRGDNMDTEKQSRTLNYISVMLGKFENPTIIALAQVDRDLEFLQKTLEHLRREGYQTPAKVEYSRSIAELSEIYAACDFVLTNRLHVFLLAALSGALPIALIEEVKDRKIIGIFETLGLRSFFCRVDSETDVKDFGPYGLDRGILQQCLSKQRNSIVSAAELIFRQKRI